MEKSDLKFSKGGLVKKVDNPFAAAAKTAKELGDAFRKINDVFYMTPKQKADEYNKKMAAKTKDLITSEQAAIKRGRVEILQNTRQEKSAGCTVSERKDGSWLITPNRKCIEIDPDTVDWADPPLGRHFYVHSNVKNERFITVNQVFLTTVEDGIYTEVPVPFLVKDGEYGKPAEVVVLTKPLYTKQEIIDLPAQTGPTEKFMVDAEVLDGDSISGIRFESGINGPPYTTKDKYRFKQDLIRQEWEDACMKSGDYAPNCPKTNKPYFKIPEEPWR